MKRRLVCLLLCAVMLLTGITATGCAGAASSSEGATGTGEETDTLQRSVMTLTLWVPTYEGTTERALEAVEEAINKITQAEYDTAIKLYGIPSDEYEEAVKKQLEDITARKEKEEEEAIARRKAEREAAKRGETYVPESTEAEKFESKYDLIVNSGIGYPHVEKNQMDIFLIRGQEDYLYYVNNTYLQPLDEDIASTSKILKSFIYPDFLTAAKVDGQTYAIPNNHVIGKYKYLLVNKRLVAELGYDESSLRTLNNCKAFVESVAASHKEVTPVYGSIAPTYMQYWSGQNQETFSTLASRVMTGYTVDMVELQNVFDINNFYEYTYLQKYYSENGYISAGGNVGEFGIGIVEATPDEIAQYEDSYYINVHERPVGRPDDYCKAMFGISVYTKSTARSMEIITRLNTEEDIRTILQYGVEGVHYKVDEEDDSEIVKLSDEYNMKLEETGNIYMTYPDYRVKKDWSGAKEQNLDSFYPVTYLLSGYSTEENAELVKSFDNFNLSIKAQMDAMTSAEFKANVESLKTMVSNNDYFKRISYVPSGNDTQLGKTEEKGYIAGNSIGYLWSDMVATMLSGK